MAEAVQVSEDGRYLRLTKPVGPIPRKGGSRALLSQDAAMVNSMTKTYQASMYNDQRSSLPFSPMTGEIIENSRQTTAPMSYDQASAFEEWPELH